MKQLICTWLCLPAILIQVLLIRNIIHEPKLISPYIEVPQVQAVENIVETPVDNRSDKLRCFFRQYNSVLIDSADTFVSSADQNGFDYRLLPAISFVESTACKHYPVGTHNCWGWGSARISFDSFDEAINYISERLAVSGYYTKWQLDRQDYWKLAVVYNGGDQVKWHKDVVSTMSKIEECL